MVRPVAICCAVLLLTTGCLYPLLPPPPPPARETSVGGFSLSPDGKFLYFGYTVHREGVPSYGSRQINWRTGEITRRDRPFSFGLTEEANTVFRVLHKDDPDSLNRVPEAIALYDYPSFQLQQTVTLAKIPEDDPRMAARWPWKRVQIVDVNVAARQALCTFYGGIGESGLCLYDLKTGKYTILVPQQEGFRTIFTHRLLARDDVFISAWDPRDERLKAEIATQLADPAGKYKPEVRFTGIPYRIRAGGKPQIVYQDILRRSADIRGGPPNTYAVSCGGRRVAFIDISPREDEAMRKAKREGRNYTYRMDVYVREGDSQRAVTNLKTYMSGIAISCDGSTVAFGTYAPLPGSSDPHDEHWSRRQFEPSVVDLDTNKVVPLRLVDRLKSEPAITRESVDKSGGKTSPLGNAL